MKIQARVISGNKKAPARKPAHRRPNLGPKSTSHVPGFFRRVIKQKKRPLPGSLHSRSNLGQKRILPKVEFGSNDLSGFEATCLLTPPAS